ncbi:tetratricopeptide repeat protein [Sphingomonas abietis]|uniref:Cytochrome C biogenesis protein n=1 Tax=Sphingomonas abietis TaxID=3012344 RepID=A0ABY7NW16_9SPHN|nr:cytochrome C biogenesis protein [Sphingomonas abietis]WBO24104.1 cytochrome C biogenesis protein [Sphingomonas abietis]
MMGWLIFAILALVILGILAWPLRLGRSALMLAAAALFTAAAGYAWQGNPGLPGAPAAGRDEGLRSDTLFATERLRFLNHFGETGIMLGTADAFHRTGMDGAAAGLLRNAILKHPDDVDLRIGYAHALFMVAGAHITPAVALAFDRADRVAKPGDPAPAYFRGFAELESGDVGAAEQRWRALYASLPAASPWRAPLAQRLAMFDMMRAAAAQREAGAASPGL